MQPMTQVCARCKYTWLMQKKSPAPRIDCSWTNGVI
jgi:hypothetical protein